MEKVSIIIPAYNAEKYINRCIESILSQTYKNLEIIIINDGSVDNTEKIITEYAKKDNRIILINQRNQGAYLTRVSGIKKSTGEYLMFIDADDFIEIDGIEKSITKIKKSDADVLRFNCIIEPSKKLKNPIIPKESKDIQFDQNKLIELLANTYAMNSLCFCLYRRKLFNNIKYKNERISYAEDYLLNIQIAKNVTKVLCIGDVVYHYTQNKTSTMHVTTLVKEQEKAEEQIESLNALWELDQNKERAAMRILNMTQNCMYKIMQKTNRKTFTEWANTYCNKQLFSKIRKKFSKKELKDIIKKYSISYRLKHKLFYSLIYSKKYSKIFLYKIIRRRRK